ncbi:Kinesin [Macleaya cordata]|uniref:Kinesin n=1 Tax=Macleaya cordata TaxID=56857 RepID=A0A200QFM4_MACCD|nr:Kinesin [Macleaya cordata]
MSGGILTQSIRNLLPRSISNKHQKTKSIHQPPKCDSENTPPVDPNVQIDDHLVSPSITRKSPLKSVSFQKDSLVSDLQDDKSATPSDPSVKVIARIRPVSWRARGELPTVRKVSSDSISVGDRTFTFDSVVDSSSTQEDVFQLVGVPVVKNSLAGYNASVLSYGQTGSGKTYTMWGPPSAMVEGHSPSSNQGIVPRIFRMLFSEIQKEQDNSGEKQINYQCRCSFLEIYNEQIGDLLDPTQRNLEIRDDAKNGFYVENLSEEYVTSFDDVTQILIKGLSNRKVGATSINSKSSRSHIVFTCVVESWCKVTSSKCISSSKTSRISLIDLAGSERNKLGDAGTQCIKEGRNVKKSLAQLGHLVNTLAEGPQPGKPLNIPYRSSCLTHLLRESFGGNAKLTVICAISPDDKCKGETLSTLRFGQCAKSIQNEPVVNEITEDDVNDLSDQIRQLKEELIKAKAVGYNSVGSNTEYFKGRSARESLNHLRLSLNRSLILTHVDNDSDEEINIDEEDVKDLRVQLEDIRSSCGESTRDPYDDKESFQFSSFEDSSDTDLNSENISSMLPCPEENEIEETQFGKPEELPFKDNGRSVACQDNSTTTDTASRTSLSVIPCLQFSVLQDPTFSESPKFENIQKKSISISSNHLAIQNHVLESSNLSQDIQRQSVRRSDQIRASLRSSKIFSGPTESLAASLHRGLQIIDHHQRNSASNKSSVAFSFDHLAVKPCQEIEKSDAGVQTLPEEKADMDGLDGSFLCAACKQPGVKADDQVEDSFNKWIVPVDGAKGPKESVERVSKDTEVALAEALKREKELENVCAEQLAKIEQLNLLLLRHNCENQSEMDHEYKNMPSDTSDREALLKEIESLKNRLQSYIDVPSDESQSIQLRKSDEESHFQDKIGEELEKERQRWTEMESEWILLTDELRIDIESKRRHAEKVEMDLRLEKKVTEELDDALDRAVLGHARIVEHYVELQEKHNELLGRHRKIMEGIAELKRAAAKAGGKGKGRFVKSLAAEFSALRVEREREREHLKKENKSLKIQLRDTAEAVHAAGELLVRLREAEEAVSVAEENYTSAQKENEKIKKQLEKQKRKHAMEMVTMKQYLAESRLPESALQPMYWQEEDRANSSNNAHTQPEDDQSWRAAFGPSYQDHY